MASFNGDISMWDVSSVTDQNLSAWGVSSMTDMSFVHPSMTTSNNTTIKVSTRGRNVHLVCSCIY
jgi:hypothetical protein